MCLVFLTLLTSSCFKQTHNSWVRISNLVDGKVLDDWTFFSLGKDGCWQQHWAFVQHGSDDCEASRKDPKVDPWIPWVKLGSDSKPRNENFYDSCKDLRNTPIFTSYWYLLLSQNGFLAPPFFQSLRDLQQLISGTLQLSGQCLSFLDTNPLFDVLLSSRIGVSSTECQLKLF